MVLFNLFKFAEIAYPVYIGCNALQNELSQEFLEDNFGDQRYYKG
jgi:hypothetical protein